MRWWLNTDDPQIFCVDNATVSGMDFSSLPANLWMVQWTDGKGELENQIDANTNDNGLRERFIDVVPYAPFFQQFLAKLPMLTLAQAQQVQIDLIKQIFESKRQDPYHYPIAAGDYTWDASDEAMVSSSSVASTNGLLNLATFLNGMVDTLNASIPAFTTDGISYVASPGLSAPIAHVVLPTGPGMQWIPVGDTVPVTVTQAEQTAILNGISARTNALAGKKNVKVAQVKALTTIPAVIAYNVTTGW
jgi:hypothetical protein